jgi:uncharacterized protein DUF4386
LAADLPRRMALLGLIGGPLIFASSTAVLFGAYEQTSGAAFIFSLPEAWEASPGIYLIAKGFKRSPILSGDTRPRVDKRSLRAAMATR